MPEIPVPRCRAAPSGDGRFRPPRLTQRRPRAGRPHRQGLQSGNFQYAVPAAMSNI